MATVKAGTTARAPELWKHLRWMKRVFWKAERRAAKAGAKHEASSS